MFTKSSKQFEARVDHFAQFIKVRKNGGSLPELLAGYDLDHEWRAVPPNGGLRGRIVTPEWIGENMASLLSRVEDALDRAVGKGRIHYIDRPSEVIDGPIGAAIALWDVKGNGTVMGAHFHECWELTARLSPVGPKMKGRLLHSEKPVDLRRETFWVPPYVLHQGTFDTPSIWLTVLVDEK